jgi:chaperonin cofactor prefoldin
METYKEPHQELLEELFEEIREGRSKKSAVKYLRKKGYTISETVLRHRYEVWLSYQSAKEEFEKKLNHLKGELKSRFNKREEFEKEAKEKINAIIRALWNRPSDGENERVGELIRLWNSIESLERENDSLKSRVSGLEKRVSELEKENERLKWEISVLAKAVYSIFEGLKHQGFTEKPWKAIVDPEKGNLKKLVVSEVIKLKNR